LKVNYIKKDFKYLLSYPDFIYKNNISIIIHCANITNKTKEKNREIHFFNSIIDNKKFAIRSSKFVKTYINISTSKVDPNSQKSDLTNLVGVSEGGVIKPFFNMLLATNIQIYVLLFIAIATVIIIALSLTIKNDKKLSASSTASIILTLSCFVFAVSVIGYLYYLNNVIGFSSVKMLLIHDNETSLHIRKVDIVYDLIYVIQIVQHIFYHLLYL
jgi:hypothetical protein